MNGKIRPEDIENIQKKLCNALDELRAAREAEGCDPELADAIDGIRASFQGPLLKLFKGLTECLCR